MNIKELLSGSKSVRALEAAEDGVVAAFELRSDSGSFALWLSP